MKKLKIVLIGVLIASIGLFYYFSINYQRIKGFNRFPEKDVQAYVYSMGCLGEKVNYTQMELTDCESLLQIASKIKYMNPNIDPLSIDYILYGGGGYEFEIVSENEVTTCGISYNELETNIRRVTLSSERIERSISAYVKEDVYKEYEQLAQKYIKNSESKS